MADPTGKGGHSRRPSDPPPALAPIDFVATPPGKKPNIRVNLNHDPDDFGIEEEDDQQIDRRYTLESFIEEKDSEDEDLYKSKVDLIEEKPEEKTLDIKNYIEEDVKPHRKETIKVDTQIIKEYINEGKKEVKRVEPKPDGKEGQKMISKDYIKEGKKEEKKLGTIPTMIVTKKVDINVVKKEHITVGKIEEKKRGMKDYKPGGKAVYVNKATGVTVKKVGKGDTHENEEDAPAAAEEEAIDISPEPQATSTPLEKKTKIQVDPNASMKDVYDRSHFMTSLPVVPEDDTPYSPILYTFRVKPKGRNTIAKHMIAKPPPFYLQFDHAIAVIWTIFNKNTNKESLGIVQLQWALHFLESIYNSEGVHPKDVQICIDSIQEYLIERYAEMSDEPAVYGTSKFEEYYKPEEPAPFSVNYSQMIKKCPRAGLSTSESGELIDKQLLDELESVKKAVGIDSIDLTKVVSKDQVMNILFEWKKEQIDKIQEELKMLYVVEDMMKNSDSQNFEGYTDETQFQSVFRKN